MKYGILTFHNIPNIGALLQGLALCKTYRNMGVDCEIIDYRCENIVDRELTYHPVKNPIKNFLYKHLLWSKTKRKISACQKFMYESKVYSTKQYTRDTIHSANEDYDVFISGSDMIWNLDVTDHDYSFFLDFVAPNKRRIASGSSIGDVWNTNDLPMVKSLLEKYEAIAVRELDTCTFINNMGIRCSHICDPTMLLNPSEWENLAIPPQVSNYVLVYFGYPQIMKSAKEYAKKHNLKLILMNWRLPKRGMKAVGPNTPPEWIGYFKNATAVFTDSYHGLLFSLYLKTPVWTANTGNRIKSLLGTLNLENRFVQNDPSYMSEIDFDVCHEKIRIIREDSLKYISKTIEICSK